MAINSTCMHINLCLSMAELVSHTMMIMLFPYTCRLHAVATHCSSDYIHSIVDAHLHELGVGSVTSREIVDVVEGYVGDGLGSSAKEETGEGG